MVKWLFDEPLHHSRATVAKSLRANIRQQYNSRKVFLIVYTTSLLRTEAEWIKRWTLLKVGKYHGNEGKYTNCEEWNKEFEKRDVFVITGKVFVEYLRHGLIQMPLIDLLIFDECHFASGNSDYNNIMKEYYFQYFPIIPM
eukprot:TRINITY_DN4444_c0_g3_i1.p1 TRINITY_DN4444_c0_g3~~TRINITY_DN4444_c0_g3_i1.p1  ORF type:complete len:141 (+),score=36.02 TRINITY_DN4444_c0_g3_i1:167-589(+)